MLCLIRRIAVPKRDTIGTATCIKATEVNCMPKNEGMGNASTYDVGVAFRVVEVWEHDNEN